MNFKRTQWLFPIAVVLHNGEEALTMPGWAARQGVHLPVDPSAAKIRAVLVVLAVAAFAVTYLSARNGPKSICSYLLFGSIVTMLANVFVPHVPATLIYRAYAPGVITAVLVNLPVMTLLSLRAVRDGWVSGWKAAAFGAIVPVVIAGLIVGLFSCVR
jgi:hypothetical protein